MKRRVRLTGGTPSLEETARTMRISPKRARELVKLADEVYLERMAEEKGMSVVEFKRRRKVPTEKAKARLRKALKPPAEGAAPRR